MLHRNQAGFTLIEMLVVLVVTAILVTGSYTFFNSSFRDYVALQQDGLAFGGLASQSQRIANVLRGSTDVISASANDLSLYAYFSPSDTYVSQIHYYLTNSNTKLMADVTPMSANPPNGTLLTAKLRQYTLISPFYPSAGGLFSYLDSAGNTLPLPISDLYTIKGIQATLSVPSKATSSSSMNTSVQVSLRNRKTNL